MDKTIKSIIRNMPKGIYQRTAKAKNAGRKASPDKMVMTSLRLPIEVKNGLTTSEKREAILIAFRNKFKK